MKIHVLNQETINQIAAGEVVERPASIVKELVENAIDAGANAVTVQIEGGGIDLIRVTDNGEGIEEDQIRTAFLRHATSKINDAADLTHIASLGFRGEALSSICAVSQVELITRRPGSILGTRYVIEGGEEKCMEQIGAPDGSTFLIRNVFYNTPARKKFLKTAPTEAGYISEMMEHIALSHPSVSFKLIVGGQSRMHTSGNGNLRDIVYSLYGKETVQALVPVHVDHTDLQIEGYICRPSVSRGNRKLELFFVNGRYIRSSLLSKAIETGYEGYIMQHRYPVTLLDIRIPGERVDVNVHPSKMEVRFSDQQFVFNELSAHIKEVLSERALVTPASPLSSRELSLEAREEKRKILEKAGKVPEPFEQVRRSFFSRVSDSPYTPQYPHRTYPEAFAGRAEDHKQAYGHEKEQTETGPDNALMRDDQLPRDMQMLKEAVTFAGQMELFPDSSQETAVPGSSRIVGQIFDTYWIVECRDRMYMIDQHAAHEKVMYEKMLRQLENKEATSQQISPPMVISLSLREEEILRANMDSFTAIGFEIEHFGGREYSIRAVPGNLYGFEDLTLFTQMLDSLGEEGGRSDQTIVLEKLASMSCKAAVKGGKRLSFEQAQALIDSLLSLDQPYHCPHGRPTMIVMNKYDIEKKFKRIV